MSNGENNLSDIQAYALRKVLAKWANERNRSTVVAGEFESVSQDEILGCTCNKKRVFFYITFQTSRKDRDVTLF